MADEQAVIDEQDDVAVELDSPDDLGDESDADEVVVTIGDESPTSEDEQEQAAAPEWVRELRKTNREDKKRIRELEDALKAREKTETKPVPLGEKPTMEAMDYDAERYEKALEAWHEGKRQHDAELAKARAAEEAQKREWQSKVDSYNSEKSKLRVRDYEDAELVAQEELSVTQQGIILHGSDNAALLTYAIGKNPAKAKELAAIQDPVKFAFAVAKLEKELKVSNRKAPSPERVVTGSGSTSSAVTTPKLERLKLEAQKTGDYTAYLAAKRQTQTK